MRLSAVHPRWLLVWLAACSGAPPASPSGPAAAMAVGAVAVDAPAPDPELHGERPRKLLDIDWGAAPLATEADALALWGRIAPTGEDWEDKLGEVPESVEGPLARALIHGGNFTCMPARPPRDCAPPLFDVDPPAAAAGLGDPCLRRLLALWALGRLDPDDVRDPVTLAAIRGIVAIPPPESQLVAAALALVPEEAHALRLELLALAWRAGQRDLVGAGVGRLDEAHLITAVQAHHIDGALDVLSARGHRAVYLKAVTDEAIGAAARASAIAELVEAEPSMPRDLRAALAKAAASPDCGVAAVAARALEAAGDHRFVPRPPARRTPASMMRALCVLASYELLQGNDEASRLAAFVPARGLERVDVSYDPLGDTDTDGDGDPHTHRTIDLVARADVVIPEVEDLVRAMRRCTGTTCTSDDREFRFAFKPVAGALALTRLEVVERPPCRRP